MTRAQVRYGALALHLIGCPCPELEIEHGALLMMIDVPLARVEEIEARVKQYFPDAEPEGTEPHVPAFP